MPTRSLPTAVLVALLACVWSADVRGAVVVEHPFLGVTHITRTETSPRNVHMHVVQVDLTAPGIRLELTPRGGTLETVRETTLAFLQETQAQVAVNGHYFLPFPSTDLDASLVGFAASNGTAYSGFESPAQSYALVADAPALNIDASNQAAIVHRDVGFADGLHVLEPVTVWNALAGSAQIVTAGVKTIPAYADAQHPQGLLVPGGPGNYSNADSWYDQINARTAIGLTQDRHTLVLFTVDAAGGSLGMSVGEVADVLIHDYAVYDALNLDGGGSTTLAMESPTTGVRSIVNVSADNPAGRAVGSTLAVSAVPDASTAITLTRGPYLQLLTTHSVTVVWNTDAPASCGLFIHPVGGSGTVVTAGAGAVCAVTVDGLTAGTSYGYVPLADGAPLRDESVFATDDPARPFIFLVFGDSGTGDANQYAVAARMLASPADLVVHTGDMIYTSGAAGDFEREFFVPYRDLLRRLALWPCLGNHDVVTDLGAPWRDAFYTPANNPAGTENYYSFDHGDAHVVVLDSNADTSPGSPQYTFADADLGASSATWKVVAFHHTIYSSGSHGSNLPIQANLVPLFDRHGVDFVFMGHDHDYERTFPLRANAIVPPGSGTIYVTTGGGGQSLTAVGASAFTAHSESVHHFTRVAVDGGTARLQMIADDGLIHDTMTVVKGAPPPPPRCGDGLVDQAGEQCDGADHTACAAGCRPDCTCAPVCGDGVVDPGTEACDGADDLACPGGCLADCRCGAVLAFEPVADTYVDASLPGTNFGTASIVTADASPLSVAYVRFVVAGVGGRPVVRAVLRLTADANVNAASPSGGSVHRISDDTWDEAAVTWDTRPAVDGPAIATAGAVAPSQVVDFDVTAAVNGDGVYSLALDSTSTDGVRYRTREVASGRPQLLVTMDADATSTTSSTTSTSTTTTSGTIFTTTTVTGTPVAWEAHVRASADDAEENATSSSTQYRQVSLTSTDLEMVHDTTGATCATCDQLVGMRWTGVSVAPGAKITGAYVQFWVDEAQSEATTLTFAGEAADSPASFTTAAGNLSSRVRTLASVAWSNVPAWATIGDHGSAQRTPDLSRVIQEIVDRPGWRSGNAMVLLVTGSGHRTAQSWDLNGGNPTQSALLHIDSVSGGATTTSTTSTTTSSSITSSTTTSSSTTSTASSTSTTASTSSTSTSSTSSSSSSSSTTTSVTTSSFTSTSTSSTSTSTTSSSSTTLATTTSSSSSTSASTSSTTTSTAQTTTSTASSTSTTASTSSTSTSSTSSSSSSTTTSATTSSSTSTSTSSTSTSTASSSSTTLTTTTSSSSSTSTSTTTTTVSQTSTSTTRPPGGTAVFQAGVSGPAGSAAVDTYIRLSAATTNYGTDPSLYVGVTNDPGKVYRTLMVFDLSSIPAGATIETCTLTMNVTQRTSPTPGHVRRLCAEHWLDGDAQGEAQATWSQWRTGQPWGAAGASSTAACGAGGDYTTAGEIAYTPPAGTGTFTFPALTMLCQDALVSRGGRLRLRISQDAETQTGNVLRFDSSDATSASTRPKLSITWSGSGTPGTTSTTSSTTSTSRSTTSSSAMPSTSSSTTSTSRTSTSSTSPAITTSTSFPTSTLRSTTSSTSSSSTTSTSASSTSFTSTTRPAGGTAVFQAGVSGPAGSAAVDTYLRLSATTTNYATDPSLYVGVTNGTTKVYRTLMVFDLSSIPAGATIQACTLTVNVTQRTSPTPGHVRRLCAEHWLDGDGQGEAQATWSQWRSGQPWGAAGASSTAACGAGGDYTTAGEIAYTPPAGTGTFTFPALTMLCQDALVNRGGRLRLRISQDAESLTGNVFRFDSSDATSASTRPKLSVTW